MKNEIQQISIIGSGNVAWHLAKNFVELGVNVSHIYGRTPKHVEELCTETGSINTRSISELPKNQFVLICTPDDSIASICDLIDDSCPVAYTSGSIEISSLPQRTNLGVFYPLQTFSKHIELDLSTVPFFIESTNEEFTQALFILASKITDTITLANSQERSELHLAAVFVNNFTNHLYQVGAQICEEQEVPFELLRPLIAETAAKIESITPKEAQTGPALRNDKTTLQKHLDQLRDPVFKNLYLTLTESIQKNDEYSKL